MTHGRLKSPKSSVQIMNRKSKIKPRLYHPYIFENEIAIFSDSATDVRNKLCGWACLILYPSGNETIRSGSIRIEDSNRGELYAAWKGFDSTRPNGSKILIATDSEYLKLGISCKDVRGYPGYELHKDLWRRFWRAKTSIRCLRIQRDNENINKCHVEARRMLQDARIRQATGWDPV